MAVGETGEGAGMKIAFVHQLPLEIYPPASNALAILAGQAGWEVRVWSSAGGNGMRPYQNCAVGVTRPDFPGPRCGSVARLAGFVRWHLRVARDLARWRPAAVISVEPHSALAVWIYYRLFGGTARLIIHHHEYYAPGDYLKPGSRTSRICHYFEKTYLFGRAVWVSQTNDARLRLLMNDCGAVTGGNARLWPNFPPREWSDRVKAAKAVAHSPLSDPPLRLICVGSLSFEDTFIREVAEWVAARPGRVSLHVCGHNVRPDVWHWLASLAVPNITCQPAGCAYDELPELLVRFAVALVLYKGNTLNFVHNVPNKAVEALVCGLEVWYPPEMVGMSEFHQRFQQLPLRQVNFGRMTAEMPAPIVRVGIDPEDFSAERAMEPLLESLREPDDA
jgi:hypothetical protein